MENTACNGDMVQEEPMRSPNNSQLAHLDENALASAAARACPTVNTINIDKSSGVHIGPKIVSVVQNIDNNEKVKGRFLGLELVSLSKRTRTLRCSVAVFLCWAFIAAVGLTLYLVSVVLSSPPQRLDIGLNETWYLRRGDWQAMPEYDKTEIKLPVETVVIGHSAGGYCSQRYRCIDIVLGIQTEHLRRFDDIGPNFLVGGTGILFEGRGANIVGVMVKNWNSKIISIMFLGDYNVHTPDDQQIEHVKVLLDVLVELNVLKSDYRLIGHCQISQTVSPGTNIRARLMEFKHYDSNNSDTCP